MNICVAISIFSKLSCDNLVAIRTRGREITGTVKLVIGLRNIGIFDTGSNENIRTVSMNKRQFQRPGFRYTTTDIVQCVDSFVIITLGQKYSTIGILHKCDFRIIIDRTGFGIDDFVGGIGGKSGIDRRSFRTYCVGKFGEKLTTGCNQVATNGVFRRSCENTKRKKSEKNREYNKNRNTFFSQQKPP